MQRQIAIVSKKSGVGIKQMAANLRFKNMVKQMSLDDRKIEKFLDGMEVLFKTHSISYSDAANLVFSLIETMLRDNIDPHKLEQEIKSKNIELQTLNAEIELKEKELEDTKTRVQREMEKLKVKEKNLQQFAQVSLMLHLYNVPEISSEYGNLARAMIGIKNLEYEPRAIVAAYNKSESLTKENERAEARLQESEKLLELYKKKLDEDKSKWADNYNAFEKFKRLLRDGLTSEVIFRAVHVLENDFTKTDIDKMIEDIRTYGNIAAAKKKLQRQNEAESGTML